MHITHKNKNIQSIAINERAMDRNKFVYMW